jgi:hypothetical protein
MDTNLRIRLNETSLRTLKERARSRRMPLPSYAAMILRYSTLVGKPHAMIDATKLAEPQELYISASLPSLLHARLISCSQRSPCSLATFAGVWVTDFLERFDRDPGDLNMMCHLGELLDRKTRLSDGDLEAVIRLAADTAIARMPVPYQVQWYHARLRPWIKEVESQGKAIPFSTEQITNILARINR